MPVESLISRRAALHQLLAMLATTPLLAQTRRGTPPPSMTVYKDPNCGCCVNWIAHARQAGITIAVRDTTDLAQVKASLGVPNDLASCHTGIIAGYLVEGHVPIDLVQRLLRERPRNALGLFVPGMPAGSPGMEGPPPARYNITLVTKTGARSTYATRMGAPARR
jgi:hypothetical protein